MRATFALLLPLRSCLPVSVPWSLKKYPDTPPKQLYFARLADLVFRRLLFFVETLLLRLSIIDFNWPSWPTTVLGPVPDTPTSSLTV